MEPVSGAAELRPFLLTPVEWGATVLTLGGLGLTMWAEFGGHPRWTRWGGIALTVSGLVTAMATMNRHRQAKKVLAADTSTVLRTQAAM